MAVAPMAQDPTTYGHSSSSLRGKNLTFGVWAARECVVSRLSRLSIMAGCALVGFATLGCEGPNGRIDPIRTGVLGAGLGAGAFGLGGLIAQDQQYRRYRPSYGHAGYGHRPYGGAYLPPVTAPSYGYGPYGYRRGYGY